MSLYKLTSTMTTVYVEAPNVRGALDLYEGQMRQRMHAEIDQLAADEQAEWNADDTANYLRDAEPSAIERISGEVLR